MSRQMKCLTETLRDLLTLEEESRVSTALFGLSMLVGKTAPQFAPPTKLRNTQWPQGTFSEVPKDPFDSPGEKLKLWRPLPVESKYLPTIYRKKLDVICCILLERYC